MSSSITIDAAQVIANLDRATGGAASSFFLRTGKVLTPIKADAAAKWPTRSGKTAAGFKLEATVTGNKLKAALANDVETTSSLPSTYPGARSPGPWPVYKHFWSRYDAGHRDAFRAKYVNDAVIRSENKGRSPAQNAVTEDRAERQMDRLMGVGKWFNRSRHWGVVPPVGFTRKNPWAWLVRKPAQVASGKLVADLQDDLSKLARGG